MNSTDYAQVGRLLYVQDPALVIKVHQSHRPTLSDLALIPALLEQYGCKIGTKVLSSEQKMLFLALVVKCYQPACLIAASIRMINGLRRALAACLGFNKGESVNYLLSMVRTYRKVSSFREQVAHLEKIILSDVSTKEQPILEAKK